MMKLRSVLILVLCILLVGCGKNINVATGNTVADVSQNEFNCVDCDDGNKCTTDVCVRETNECKNIPISKCCGDGKCDADESCYTCNLDCGKCYSMEQLQLDINKVYSRKITLAKNKVMGKEFGEIPSSKYDFYDSGLITVIKIKDNSDLILSSVDFKAFLEELTSSRFYSFLGKMDEKYPSSEYRYLPDYNLEESGTLAGETMTYSFWAVVYKKYRSCATCNNDNSSYETEMITDPEIDTTVYLWCSPDIIIGLRNNQPQMLEKFWTNMDENEYLDQIQKWSGREEHGSMDEASKLAVYCSQEE